MGFLVALRFLTILPLPLNRESTLKDAGRSPGYFPLVGLLLGLTLAGLDQLLNLALPILLVNALLLIALIIFTGALHLEGFIDTCDAVIAWRSREERLSIMSDKRVGAYGVVGASCLLLLKYFSLASVPGELRFLALILMPSLSRWGMVCAIFAFPYAKAAGMGLNFKQQMNWKKLAMATLICLIPTVALAKLSGLSLMLGLVLIIWGIGNFFRHRLGGLTGDTYGAINELAEVFILILLPLFTKLVPPI